MSHYLDARAALLTALKKQVGDTKLIADGVLDDKEERYFRFSYLPAGDTPTTLGQHGKDTHTGLAQIDVCTKAALGFKAHYELVTTARDAYAYGVAMPYGSVSVTIAEVTIAPVSVDGDLYRRSALSVYFTYRVNRN